MRGKQFVQPILGCLIGFGCAVYANFQHASEKQASAVTDVHFGDFSIFEQTGTTDSAHSKHIHASFRGSTVFTMSSLSDQVPQFETGMYWGEELRILIDDQRQSANPGRLRVFVGDAKFPHKHILYNDLSPQDGIFDIRFLHEDRQIIQRSIFVDGRWIEVHLEKACEGQYLTKTGQCAIWKEGAWTLKTHVNGEKPIESSKHSDL